MKRVRFALIPVFAALLLIINTTPAFAESAEPMGWPIFQVV
jgi:hypothetical protein